MTNSISIAHSRGVALVLSLLLLLVMTLAGISAMSGSSLQERMAGNQKRAADSAMAADAAVGSHLEWLADNVVVNWSSNEWPNSEANPGKFGYAGQSGDDAPSRFYVTAWHSFGEPASPCDVSDSRCTVRAVGESVADGDRILARTHLESTYEYSEDEIPLGGGADILCGNDIKINVMVFTNASVHCNGDTSSVENRGRGSTELINSTITSNGTADVKVKDSNCTDCSVEDDAGIDNPPPPIRERVLEFRNDALLSTVDPDVDPGVNFLMYDTNGETIGEKWMPIANDLDVADFAFEPNSIFANCGSAPTCDFSGLTQADSGTVLFCNGNVDFGGGGSNPISDLTVIATCDITHNGRASSGDGEVNNVFYAGRDIIFNGASGPFEGRFFAGGDIDFNGDTELTGQIIAEGDIDQSGHLTFEGASSLGGNADSILNIFLAMTTWRQNWCVPGVDADCF